MLINSKLSLCPEQRFNADYELSAKQGADTMAYIALLEEKLQPALVSASAALEKIHTSQSHSVDFRQRVFTAPYILGGRGELCQPDEALVCFPLSIPSQLLCARPPGSCGSVQDPPDQSGSSTAFSHRGGRKGGAYSKYHHVSNL